MCIAGRVQTRQKGSTALHMASENGHKAVVRLLLERGANIEAKSKVRRGARSSAVGRLDGYAYGK